MNVPFGPMAVYGFSPRNSVHAPAHDWTTSAPHCGYWCSRAKTYPATIRPIPSAARMRARREGTGTAASPAARRDSEAASGDGTKPAVSEAAITESCGRVSTCIRASRAHLGRGRRTTASGGVAHGLPTGGRRFGDGNVTASAPSGALGPRLQPIVHLTKTTQPVPQWRSPMTTL